MNKNTKDELTEFNKIINDMLNDLLITYPELNNKLNEDLLCIKNNNDEENLHINNIYTYCQKVFPERFFDILYQRTEIFHDKNMNLEFLPGIDFKDLWTENITEHTREIIWKYLQLILFTIVSSLSDSDSFGDTAKLFEAINQDEFKSKLEETISQMQNIFDINSGDVTDSSNINMENLPDAENIHEHINSMMEGKLGSLAREIAEETAKDMSIDFEDSNSVNDVFKKLFKNPTKLMDLVQNVGSKLDDKLKSGELNETELLKEATDLVHKMKDMPGMENIQSMLNKMGIPTGGGKVNTKAMESHLKTKLNYSQQKDRMRAKLVERQKLQEQQKQQQEQHQQQQELESTTKNMVFSTGETYDKSYKSDAKGNNKKKKKNKNVNPVN